MNANLLTRLQAWLVRAVREPRLDLPLLSALLLLAACGLMTLYSASDLDSHLLLNQAMRFVLGGALMLLISRVPPTVLRNWTPWLYAASAAWIYQRAIAGNVGISIALGAL